jgi:hypothetical protein
MGAALATGGATAGAPFLTQMGAQSAAAGGIGMARGGPEQALVDAALGAGGEVLGKGAQVALAPGLRGASQGSQILTDSAEQMGYRVLPSTRASGGGERFRNTFEGGLEAIPGSSAPLARLSQDNQALFNRTAAEALGEQAEGVTDTVLSDARKRLGGIFDQLMGRERQVPVTDEVLARIAAIDEDSIAPFIRGEEDPVGSALTRLRELLGEGTIDAATLMKQQSRLGKQARQAFRGENSNPDLGHGLLDIQEVLLDMAQSGLSQQEREAFRVAREQYRTLSSLETGTITNAATGDVSPAKLANFLQRRDPRGFLEGGNRSPLYEGTRFLGRVQKPNASSGTAERMWAQGAIGGAAGAVASPDESELMGAGAGAALGLGLPYGLARGYLSQPLRNWVTRSAGPAEQTATRLAGHAAARSQQEAQAMPAINPVQWRRLNEAVDMAASLGAEHTARRLALYRSRFAEGRGTAEDLDKAQGVLRDARDRARRAGDEELVGAIENVFLDTRSLFFDED